MTRNGVVYNLPKSPYIVERKGIKFYFSSENHREKFLECSEDNTNTITYSLYKRFKVWLMCEELCDLVLYNKVETRGFYVTIDGEEYKCLNEITLDGVKRITRKLQQ